jgi:hypothetical protein
VSLALINISDLTANYHLIENEEALAQRDSCLDDALQRISADFYATGTYALNIGNVNCNYEVSPNVSGTKIVTTTAASFSDLGYWQGSIVANINVSSTPMNIISYRDLIIDDWLYAGWSNRIRISVQPDKVSGDVFNFPVYVDLNDLGNDFFGIVDSDGADIVVTTSGGGIKLLREVVDIDTSAKTGELHFEAPFLSSSVATDFYIYYGNGSATETNDSDLWIDYAMVQHLNEDPSGSAPQMIDSTVNHRDGTSGGTMLTADLVPGTVGTALDFDGTDDYIEVPYTITPAEATFSLWVQPHAYGLAYPDTSGALAREYTWRFYQINSSAIYFSVYNGTDKVYFNTDPGETPALDEWSHVAWTFNGGTDEAKVYLNGELVKETTNAAFPDELVNYNNKMYIGLGNSPAWYELDGLADEVRFMEEIKDLDWIATEYNNQLSSITFYSTSTPDNL